MIVAMTTALLALVLIFLSVRVIGFRRRHKVAVGDGGHEDLKRAIRAQGNFSEYVPVAILLLYGMDHLAAQQWLILLGAVLLVVGRLLHAFSISQTREPFPMRVAGMMMTFGSMLIAVLTTVGLVLLG